MSECDSIDLKSTGEKNFVNKILIADDYKMNIEALQTILKTHGINEYISEESSPSENNNIGPPQTFGFGG